jgi:hypothetical protein
MWRRLVQLPKPTLILEGEAPGADTMARRFAEEIPWLCYRPFPAQWHKYGRAAGPIRNREMLDEEPHLGIAFYKNIQESKGTIDCMREGRKRGIEFELHP